jgi:hypothetical protein
MGKLISDKWDMHVGSIQQAQDKVKWRAIVSTVMNTQVPKKEIGDFMTNWVTIKLSRIPGMTM